ncbi:MAG: hypothetical protein QM796_13560 [Chthoniobacteraceae bacterium]
MPHDWSIEDLPAGTGRVGPFDPAASENQDKTGYTVGGIGCTEALRAGPGGEAGERAV